MEEGEHEDTEEEKLARRTDQMVGEVYDALPPDSILVVATCQGDTAHTRLMNVGTL